MKKLIFLLLLFAGIASEAQVINQTLYPAYGYRLKRGIFDSTLVAPKDSSLRFNTTDAGAIIYNTGDSALYAWNGSWWLKQGRSGSGGGTAINVDYVADIATLKSYSGTAKAVIVQDTLQGQGNIFTLQTGSFVSDSGIIFPATGLGSGKYWRRNWNGSIINPKWYGAKGDGVTDDSRALNKIGETFALAGQTTGIAIMFSPGIYRLKNVIVRSGMKIYAEQNARNNVASQVPVKILPVSGVTDTIFAFRGTAQNASIENLYIDGDFQNNLNMTTAISFSGSFCILKGNNVINCANHAVYSNSGAFEVLNNNFQGMAKYARTFTGTTDFQGTFHVIISGDSKLIGNEIGASAPYLAGQVSTPDSILRDPAYKRVVAFAGTIYFGNSEISGNIFENGDMGCAIGGCQYASFSNNRFEMNAAGGLYLYGGVYYTTFLADHYTNNSLSKKGGYIDLTLGAGAVAFCTFNSLVFQMLPNTSVIPTSNYKVKYNIANYGSSSNKLVTPTFSQDINRYDSLGHFDTSILSQPFKWVEGQVDPWNPIYHTVIAGSVVDTGAARGYVKMQEGTTAIGGNNVGVLGFFKPNNSRIAAIGFNPDNNLNFGLDSSNAAYIYNNGNIVQTNPNGANFIMISDSIGTSQIHMSSDNFATHALDVTLDNVHGGTKITSGDTIAIGLVNSVKYAPNGKTFLPFVPGLATFGSYNLLARDTLTGEMVLTNTGSSGVISHAINGLNAHADTVSLGGDLIDSTVVNINGNWLSFFNNTPTDTSYFSLGKFELFGSILNGNKLGVKDVSTSTFANIWMNSDFPGSNVQIFAAKNDFSQQSSISTDLNGVFSSTNGISGIINAVYATDNGGAAHNNIIMDGGVSTDPGVLHITHFTPAESSNKTSHIELADSTLNIGIQNNSTSKGHINISADYINMPGTAFTAGSSSGAAGSISVQHLTSEIATLNSTVPLSRVQAWTDGVSTGGIKIYDLFGKGAVFESDYSAIQLTDPMAVASIAAVRKVAHDSLSAGSPVTLDRVLANGNTSSRIANIGGLGVSGPAYFGGGLYITPRVITTTSSLSVSDIFTVINNSGAVTITLPPVASSGGQTLSVKKVSAALNNVTVQGNASELIDGANTKVLTLQYSSIILNCDGTKWYMIASAVGGATL